MPSPDASTPRYLQIAASLRAAIQDGTYGPGEQLPGNRAIMAAHGVSLTTARQAIAVVEAEGLVDVRPGSGVFVRGFRRDRRRSVSRLAASHWGGGRSIWDADVPGRSLTVDQVEIGVEPDPPPSTAVLDLADGEDVLCRARRFVLDGKPVLLSRSYLPARLVAGTAITQPDSGPGGTYARLAELGQAPATFQEDVLARMPTPDETGRLALRAGTPVLLITRIARTGAGRAVEVNEMIADAGAYVLEYLIDA